METLQVLYCYYTPAKTKWPSDLVVCSLLSIHCVRLVDEYAQVVCKHRLFTVDSLLKWFSCRFKGRCKLRYWLAFVISRVECWNMLYINKKAVTTVFHINLDNWVVFFLSSASLHGVCLFSQLYTILDRKD